MAIIRRYILKEILKYFGMVLFMVVAIYLVVDFIEKIDDFLEADLPIALAFRYFLYRVPSILAQIIPLSALLAVLITFGLMVKNNEMIALRAGGISLLSLLGPVVRFGIWGFLSVLLLNELVSPLAAVRANRIWLQDVRHRQEAVTWHDDIWLKENQSIVHLKYYQSKSRIAMGLTIHRFDRGFNLIERLDATSAVFQNDQWQLNEGIQQLFNPKTQQFDVVLFDRHPVQLGVTPADLEQAAPRTEEMSLIQLYRYVQKVEAEGYDAVQYKVDLHAKIAFPFACIIMVLVGAGLTARGKIKEGLPVGISYGIGIAFVYWIAFGFCISLGYAAKLPPVVAAWTVNLIWMCLATFMLLNADR